KKALEVEMLFSRTGRTLSRRAASLALYDRVMETAAMRVSFLWRGDTNRAHESPALDAQGRLAPPAWVKTRRFVSPSHSGRCCDRGSAMAVDRDCGYVRYVCVYVERTVSPRRAGSALFVVEFACSDVERFVEGLGLTHPARPAHVSASTDAARGFLVVL